MELELNARRVLQWEDLEELSSINENIVVELNDEKYIINYNKEENKVDIYSFEELNYIITFSSKNFECKKFFDNLNLLIIEE